MPGFPDHLITGKKDLLFTGSELCKVPSSLPGLQKMAVRERKKMTKASFVITLSTALTARLHQERATEIRALIRLNQHLILRVAISSLSAAACSLSEGCHGSAVYCPAAVHLRPSRGGHAQGRRDAQRTAPGGRTGGGRVAGRGARGRGARSLISALSAAGRLHGARLAAGNCR